MYSVSESKETNNGLWNSAIGKATVKQIVHYLCTLE